MIAAASQEEEEEEEAVLRLLFTIFDKLLYVSMHIVGFTLFEVLCV